jgi:hypothetical protein
VIQRFRNALGREGKAHGSPYGVGASAKNSPFQNFLHHRRVATKSPRRHVVSQQSDDRGSAGADRVTAARAVHTVVRPDPDHRVFLFG